MEQEIYGERERDNYKFGVRGERGKLIIRGQVRNYRSNRLRFWKQLGSHTEFLWCIRVRLWGDVVGRVVFLRVAGDPFWLHRLLSASGAVGTRVPHLFWIPRAGLCDDKTLDHAYLHLYDSPSTPPAHLPKINSTRESSNAHAHISSTPFRYS